MDSSVSHVNDEESHQKVECCAKNMNSKLEQLKLRDEQRKAKQKADREQRKYKGGANEDENVDRLRAKFDEMEAAVRSRFLLLSCVGDCEATSTGRKDKDELLEQCYAFLMSTEQFLSSSMHLLNAYYSRLFQERLKALKLEYQQLEQKLKPKKEFHFGSDCTSSEAGEENEHDDKPESSAEYSTTDGQRVDDIVDKADSNGCEIYDRRNEKIELSRDMVLKKDVSLTRLEGCEVRIRSCLATLYMSCLKDCIILSGPVSTSIFVENCKNCTFVVACQQLRVHSVKECCLYVHITAKTIIEDSEGVHIGPYPDQVYENVGNDFLDAGLDKSVNKWSLVDDFNWLLDDVPSPNWNIIPEHERRCPL